MLTKISGATRLVYAWLQDDEGSFKYVCTLKGEARVDAIGDPAPYLAQNLQEHVGEVYGQLGEDTLVTKMFTWALGEVQWDEMARWVMRDDATWPAVDPGPLEETP